MRQSLSIDGAERDAFDQWRHQAFEMMDVRLPADRVGRSFSGSALWMERGGIGVWRYRSDAVDASRDAARCRRDQGDAVIVLLMRAGTAELVDSRCSLLRPGDLYLFDMARPLEIRWQPHEELHFVLPRAVLSGLLKGAEGLCGLHLAGTTPLGRALAQQLVMLDRALDDLDETTGGIMVRHGMEMLFRILADLRQGREPRRDDRRAAVIAAIDDNLRNPELGPALLASLLGFSRRSLYRCLADDDAGIARLIQERRLLRCREAIAAPSSRGRRLADIALEWGFLDYQSFCRAFRRRFHMTPSEARAASPWHAGSSFSGTERLTQDE